MTRAQARDGLTCGHSRVVHDE